MTESFKVLVVDDEEGMRLGVERALSRYVSSHADLETEARYDVETADTGEQALAAVDRDPPDIVLLDYKLPALSGLDVLQRLRPHQDRMLTVMITAYASLQTAIEATKSGAFDFLPKPFTPEELKATIRKAARHLILQRRAASVQQERQRARFELISVVSHELKAPLAAIEGFLNLLEGGYVDAAGAQKLYARCRGRIDGMRKLIFDLLDLTRIESGQRRRELRTLDLVPVLREFVESMKPAAAERGIELRITCPENSSVTADPMEVEIIVRNLVSNAIKYNREGGSVDVVFEASPLRNRLRVADTGIGIAEEDLAKLFGEFVRIRNRETAKIPGSGLGLSIVRRLAALYDGEVTVKSSPGAGSTFTFDWPGSSAQQNPEALAPCRSPGKGSEQREETS